MIIKSPEGEKMGEVSESELEEKKKPPDKTAFEGSEVEDIGMNKNAIEGMLNFINKTEYKMELLNVIKKATARGAGQVREGRADECVEGGREAD